MLDDMLVLDENGGTDWKSLENLSYNDYLCVSPNETLRDNPLNLNIDKQQFSKHKGCKSCLIPEKMTPDLAYVLGGLDAEGGIKNL